MVVPGLAAAGWTQALRGNTHDEGIGAVTRIRKLGAMALATPLAVGFTILGAPLPAEAAAAGITSPASGAVITHGPTVTVTATAPLFGGTLYVYPPVGESVRVGSAGSDAKLSGSVPIGRNGPYKIELQGMGGSTRTFYVRVPPAAPGGLSAAVSGKKLTVRWNLGLEDDLTGYKVAAGGSSRSIGTSCPGSICSASFTLPSNAGGSVKVGVQARRSNGSGGTVVSGISRTSVTLGAGGGGGASGGSGATPNMPNYAYPNGNNTPLTPVNPNSGLNLPTVAPDGSTPGFVYPTPPPEVATQNQVTTKAKPVAEVSRMAWGRSLALALILLVCAAHLGTWTRRLRFAQAGFGRGGRLGRKGGGKARVKTAHERIAQAEALAKTGNLTKADILGKAAAAAAQSPKVAGNGKAGAEQPAVRGKGRSKGRSTAERATGSGDPAAAMTKTTETETEGTRKTEAETDTGTEAGMDQPVRGKADGPAAKDQVEEAVAALTGLATRTDLHTPPVAASPTIAESAARVARPVAPIQPLDRPATGTAPLIEIAEDGAGTPGTGNRGRKTSRNPIRGRRRPK
jgi:hypothetical protein